MEETGKDGGNKDLEDDEELAALRLAALATLKHRKKENINETSTSQSLPINSIISVSSNVPESKKKHIPFVQSDRTLYNVHSWRKQSQPIRRRGGTFPKSSQRSNLIIISPVSLEGNNGSDHKPASAVTLPQQKWCSSANEDSMSPKTLRRTGPTRFNRHGSDSESSDSDYDDNSGNDSGSNETVLQDEPSDHFNCSSELKSEASGSVEKQRRLSFQNMESDINSDVLSKSDTTSVYNCLKNSNSTYDSTDRCNSYTSVQNENDGRIIWEQSSENDYNQYSNKSSSKPLEARRGFTKRKTSIINGDAHVGEINNFSAQLPDISILQHAEKHVACNSYYTKDASMSDSSRKYKDDAKLKNYSDNPNRSDCFTWKDNKHESNTSVSCTEALNNTSDSRTPAVKSNYSSLKSHSLSQDDLRLELKKRLHEYTSKDEIDKNERSENRIHNQNYWNKNRERGVYKSDYDSSHHRSRRERSFSKEKNVSENNSELQVEVHEHNLLHDRSKPDYNSNRSKIKQGYSLSTEQNRNSHGSSHGKKRSSRSSSHERSRHSFNKEKYADEHSPNSRRNRRERSLSSQRSRHDRRSRSKSRLGHSSSSKRSRHGHSSNLKRNRYNRSPSLKRSRRARSSSSKRSRSNCSSTSKSRSSSCSKKSRSDRSCSSKGSRSDDSSSSSRTKHDRSSSGQRSGHEHSASPYSKRHEYSSNSYKNKHNLSSKKEHDSSCETSVQEHSSSRDIKKQKDNLNEERKIHVLGSDKDGKKSDSSSSVDKEKKGISSSQNKSKRSSTQRKSSVECSSNTSKDQAGKSEHSQFQDHTLHQEQFLEEHSTSIDNKQDSFAFQSRINEDDNVTRQKDKCDQGKLKFKNSHREKNLEAQQKWNKERTRQHRSKSSEKSGKELRNPSYQSKKCNSNYKRRYSRSRSRSWSSSASSSSSTSSQSSRPKIRSVPSVVKPVPSKVLTAEKKDSFIDSKFETNRNSQLFTSKSDTIPLPKKSLDVADHNKLQSSNRFGQMEGDVKANIPDSNKRVPVHMRLGVFPRKRVIQMAKDVEAAFVNSSSSDDESVNNKCKRQNIRIVTDVDTRKEDSGVEKKYSIKDRIDKRPSDIFTEKSKKLKINR